MLDSRWRTLALIVALVFSVSCSSDDSESGEDPSTPDTETSADTTDQADVLEPNDAEEDSDSTADPDVEPSDAELEDTEVGIDTPEPGLDTDVRAGCDAVDIGCEEPGTFCEGDVLVTCVEDQFGCLGRLEFDCGEADEVCAESDGEASCEDEIACTDTDCTAEGIFCDGDIVLTCAVDERGCLVVEGMEDCSEFGQICVDGPPAGCEAPEDLIVVGNYSYEVVADLDSINPGDFGPFQYLEQNPTLDPATEEPTVYFRATSNEPVTPPQSSPAQAVFRWSPSTGIQLLAQATNPIPGGTGGFTNFAELVINPPVGYGGVVAFVGNGMNLQRGVYRYADGVTGLIADKSFAIPSGDGAFTGLGEPIIYGDEILFLGTGAGQGGFYRWNAGDPVKVVDTNDPNPVADGNYTGVGFSDFNGTECVFFGYGVPLPGATYMGFQTSLFIAPLEGGPHQVIATKETEMPDVDDTFTILTGGLFDGDGVFFHGRGSVGPIGPFGSIVHKGLYRWEDGAIEKVVNTDDTMPDSDVTFSKDFTNGITSQYMAAAGGNMLYRGVGTVEDEKVLFGIYLYRGDTGQSEKVLDTSDDFDGKVMTDILMSRNSYQGDHFVFWIKFEDGTQGIYLGRPLAE